MGPVEDMTACASRDPKEANAQFQSLSAAAAKSLQSCPTLCNPIDSSPPGSSTPGILQARILGWVAISFSPLSATLLKQFCERKNPAGEIPICAAKNHERTLYSVPASFSHSSQAALLAQGSSGEFRTAPQEIQKRALLVVPVPLGMVGKQLNPHRSLLGRYAHPWLQTKSRDFDLLWNLKEPWGLAPVPFCDCSRPDQPIWRPIQ